MPEVVALIEGVVPPPGDHEYETAGDELRFTELPGQNVVGPEGVMEAMGKGLTETVTGGEVPTHPLVVTVTEYVPATPVVIDCVVCPPGDQL